MTRALSNSGSATKRSQSACERATHAASGSTRRTARMPLAQLGLRARMRNACSPASSRFTRQFVHTPKTNGRHQPTLESNGLGQNLRAPSQCRPTADPASLSERRTIRSARPTLNPSPARGAECSGATRGGASTSESTQGGACPPYNPPPMNPAVDRRSRSPPRRASAARYAAVRSVTSELIGEPRSETSAADCRLRALREPLPLSSSTRSFDIGGGAIADGLRSASDTSRNLVPRFPG